MKKIFATGMLIACMGMLYVSCSKGGSSGTQQDPCAGVNIVVSGTVTDATTGQNNGSIAASATGSTGFTYSLNNGAFQTSGTFSNLAAGTYTITAKSGSGCTGSKQFTVNATASCATITVTTGATDATPCSSTEGGTITITANGSTGFTYSLNNGTFQSSNSFGNLAPGSYTVTAKDANGCTQSASVTVNPVAAGPLFTAVRSVLQNNCVGCHNNNNQQGGMNWTVDCNIVDHSGRIKTRAVDQAGTANQMPKPPNAPLSTADQQKIVDWINAGGKYTN